MRLFLFVVIFMLVSQNATSWRKEELQYFSLSEIFFTGSITLPNKKIYALLTTPDGTTHSASIGNKLGEHSAQILEISETEIKLCAILSTLFLSTDSAILPDHGEVVILRRASAPMENRIQYTREKCEHFGLNLFKSMRRTKPSTQHEEDRQ